jgi:Flp pilus assembly protein TadG
MKSGRTTIRNRQRVARRGAVLVEFVFVIFLLIILLFGIIEVGMLMKDRAIVAQAAREAARSASVGSQPSVANQRARNTATGITIPTNNITLERSSNNGESWTTLQTTGTTQVTNDAVVGELVRATVTYTHPLITSFIYSGGSKVLTSTVTMRRE